MGASLFRGRVFREEAAPGVPLDGLGLYDVAPTLLGLFGLPIPAGMNGLPISQ